MVYNSGKSNEVLEVSSGIHGLEKEVDSTSKEDGHIWERPWTTNEIRKNGGNWTLAGDVGLLNHLKEFSHKLISRTHEMEKVVDSVVHKSKVAYAKVNNVINDFQMLSNLQFVENRVYDEEVKDQEPAQNLEPQTKSKEQREVEMVPRIVKALELGVSVLDKAFERIDVEETSESEDDEDVSQGRTILEPKDLYEHRPLPYIIGSEEFLKDDQVGLRSFYEEDISTDISTQDDNISASESEQDSEEEEESDFEEPPHKPTFVAEHKETKSSVDTLHDRYSESESSDLFEAEDEEEERGYPPLTLDAEKPKENVKSSLIEELMKKSKPALGGTKPENIQNPLPVKVPENDDNDDLFASNDSFLDEEESPFRKKTGLFSADGLFGSEKEDKFESDLFDKDETPPPSIVKTVAPKPKEEKTKPVKDFSARKSTASPDLFGVEDDDSEHDLFSSITAPLSRPTETKKKVLPTNVTKKKDVTSSPIEPKKDKKPFTLPAKTKSVDSLFGDDSDENDLFSTTTNKGNQKSVDFGSLVNDEDDDDDDLFSVKPSVSAKTDTKFLDTNKVAPKTVKEKPISLFEESDSFDLFNPSKEIETKSKSESTKDTKKETKASEPAIREKKSSSLFEDSDNFDLFTAPKEVKKEVEVVKKPETKDKTVVTSKVKDSLPTNATTKKPEQKEKSVFTSKSADSTQASVAAKISPVLQTTAPKVDEDDENKISLGFDEPVSGGSTLSVINKDRIKIQAKRRKPTRKGRQSRLSTDPDSKKSEDVLPTSNTDFLGGQNAAEPDIFSAEAYLKETSTKKPTAESPSKKIPNIHKKEEQSKKNLMSQLITEAAISKIGKRNSLLDIENDDNDLFADKTDTDKSLGSDFSLVSPTSPKPGDSLAKNNSEGDVAKGGDSSALSDSTSDDDLFSAPAFTDFRNSISDRNSIFDDDDDDIFKPLKNKDASTHGSGDIVIDSEEDIFAGVEKEKYEMFPTQPYDDEDDDDIFSNIEKSSKTPTVPQEKLPSSSKKEKSKDDVDIFSDPLGGLALND